MTVLITETDARGRLLATRQLCETHGRSEAARLKARWPEPHEYSASSWDKTRRYRVDVRVLKHATEPCDDCNAPTEEEINAFVRGEDTPNTDQRFEDLVAWVVGPRPK